MFESGRERAELYTPHSELGYHTYNIKFTVGAKQALMKLQHTVSLKTYALILFSKGSLSAFLYPNVFTFSVWYGCHQMDPFALWQETNIKVLWEDCKPHSVLRCLCYNK